jgi:hypothetical protein
MFVPFQRPGDTGTTIGVGLGLTVSRGLTEAMRGTLGPEQTPGGGLPMAISCLRHPGRTRHIPASQAGASAKRPDRPPRRAASRGAWGWPGAGVTVSRSPAARRSRGHYAQCWREVQCRSASPGHASQAAGFGAATLQTWFRPPGRQSRGVTWQGH